MLEEGKPYVIGIDLGSVSLSVAQLSQNGRVLKHLYFLHKGKIRESLKSLNSEFDLASCIGIGCTSSKLVNPSICSLVDPQIALINAVKKNYPKAASILNIGAEKFFLIKFSPDGKYSSTINNTSCAAGTGSFLDQQARRLNLKNIGDLSDMAVQHKGPGPGIASRCAVFAKTDLIHAQQKGYSLEAICDSLCRGLAENICDSLFNKVKPEFPMILVGGVAKNQSVIRHLEKIIGRPFIIPENPTIFGAYGAALEIKENIYWKSRQKIESLDEILSVPENEKKNFFHDSLKKIKPVKNDETFCKSLLFHPAQTSHMANVEVDIYRPLNRNSSTSVFLGVDIGSTSTKAILIDESKSPIAGFYTYTAGKPLDAVSAIFAAIQNIEKEYLHPFVVKGAGTTGSGRKFAGKIIGADNIIDEITAHARAAIQLNPLTDTIIEIGGQDAKFTSLDQGTVTFLK